MTPSSAESVFDSSWYLSQYPDVARSGLAPLDHYRRFGDREKRNPHPLFETSWYQAQVSAVALIDTTALDHYLQNGAIERSSPHPLFDARFYLEQNPDVAASEVNPLVHYLHWGAAEGRNPNEFFDSFWYLEQNPEVAAEGANPLRHYVEIGARDGRNPHPLFDASYYRRKYLDGSSEETEPLRHYLIQGRAAGCFVNRLFDPELASESVETDATLSPRGSGRDHRPEEPPTIPVEIVPLAGTMTAAISVLLYEREDIAPDFLKRLLLQVAATTDEQELSCVLCLTFNYVPSPDFMQEVRRLIATFPSSTSVQLFENGFNLGFGAGHNAVFERIHSDIFILLNSDLHVMDDDWIAKLAGRFRSSPAAIIGPASNASCVREDGGGIPVPHKGARFDFLDGSLLAIRSDIARRFGLFSPSFEFFYFEDIDLNLRYRQMGLTIEAADIPCRHQRNSSTRLLPKYAVENVLNSNRARFLARWGPYLKTRRLPNRLAVRFASLDRQFQCASLPSLFGLLEEHPTAILDVTGVHAQLLPLFAHERIRVIPSWQTLVESDYARSYDLTDSPDRLEPLALEIADKFLVQPRFDACRAHLKVLVSSNPADEARAPIALIYEAREQPLFEGRHPRGGGLRDAEEVLQRLGFRIKRYTEYGIDEMNNAQSDTTHVATSSGLGLLCDVANADVVVTSNCWAAEMGQLLNKRTMIWTGAISAAASAWNLECATPFADETLQCLGCHHRFGHTERNICLRRDVACTSPELGGRFATAIEESLEKAGQTSSTTRLLRRGRRRIHKAASEQEQLRGWPRTSVTSVLLLSVPPPEIKPATAERARILAQRAIDGLSDCEFVEEHAPELAVARASYSSRVRLLAAIRQKLVTRHLRDHRWVFWVDPEIIDYPPELLEQLIARVEGGIAAPLVLTSATAAEVNDMRGAHEERLYDRTAFIENGRPARLNAPYFDQPGPVYDLDAVGSCYLVDAAIYRKGARHDLDAPSATSVARVVEGRDDFAKGDQGGATASCSDHYNVCAFARQLALPVRCFGDIKIYADGSPRGAVSGHTPSAGIQRRPIPHFEKQL